MDVFVLIAFTWIKNGWVTWFTLNVVLKGVGRGGRGGGVAVGCQVNLVCRQKENYLEI